MPDGRQTDKQPTADLASDAPLFLRYSVALGAATLAVFTGLLIVTRLPVNFDHEWVESTVVRSIRQIMTGGSMYPAPSVQFLGDGYPPLYFHVCATLAAMFGNPLLIARCVSVFGTLVIAWILYAASQPAHREFSRSPSWRLMRWMPPLCFIGFFGAGGQVYDLARVDMFTLALAAGATIMALRERRLRGGMLAGVLMGLAMLAKHNMVLVGAAIGFAMLLIHVRWAILYGVIALSIPIGIYGLMHVRTDGWSTYHLFTQLADNEFGGRARWIRFFGEDIGWHGVLLAALLTTAVAGAWRHCRRTSVIGQDDRAAMKRRAAELAAPLIIAAGALAMTISGRLKIGGYPNNLVPTWIFALLALAVTLPTAWHMLTSLPARDRRTWLCMAHACILGIVASLGYATAKLPLRDYLSRERRTMAAAELEQWINAQAKDGPVWIPAHSGLYAHTEFAHLCPIGFTIDRPERPARTMFEQDAAAHLARKTWSAIFLDDQRDRFISPRIWTLLNEHYEEIAFPIRDTTALEMLSGKRTGPKRCFVRRTSIAAQEKRPR